MFSDCENQMRMYSTRGYQGYDLAFCWSDIVPYTPQNLLQARSDGCCFLPYRPLL
jgi:hypothetical protein